MIIGDPVRGFLEEWCPPPPSIRHGVRIVPLDGTLTVKEVLLVVGAQVGHDKLSHAS